MNTADTGTGRFVEAGLYDPAAPDAPDRLALLQYLAECGVSLDAMVAADREGDLPAAAFDHRLSAGERSAAELAARLGVPTDEVVETFRLLGVTIADPDERRFADGEERVVELLHRAQELFPPRMAQEILRSIGAGLSMMAEAAVSAYMGTVEGDIGFDSPLEQAVTTTMAGELGLELGTTLQPLLRHHLWASVMRQREAMRGGGDRRESKLSVGFVDLVGFTPSAGRMGSAELVDFVTEFHRRTFDVVSRAGGRLVKHIGDEVMFSSADPDQACEIAVALIEAFAELPSPPRGGLAHGIVVARHGDYYGPTVNLAARLADIAVPGEVLVEAGVREVADPTRFAFEPAGRRMLKGFEDPVEVVSLRRGGLSHE